MRFKFAHYNPISSLDYRDVYFTSSKKSRSGLTAFEVIIINSDKSHIPGGVAGSGQIIKALTVTVVPSPYIKPIYTVVILTIPHLKQTQRKNSGFNHLDFIN